MAGDTTYSDLPPPSHIGDADLGDRPGSNYSGSITAHTPEMADSALLGPAGVGPAPSLMSRDSTYGSLGSPSMHGGRSSWGSSNALAGAMGGTAGSELPPGARGPARNSRLAQGYTADDGYNTPFDNSADGQGHIAPATAVPTTDREKEPAWASKTVQRKRKRRTWLWILLALIALVCIGLAVGLGVGLTRPKNNSAGSGSDKGHDGDKSDHGSATDGDASATSASSATPSPTPTSGTQGSVIRLADGTNMTYDNPHGGTWVWDEANPFNNEAQVNSWTPPLNQNWTWGVDIVHGVNLGGWLNTEPFIVPGLYETYATGPAGTAVDEYTLSINMGDNLTAAMTEHYETFVTERDFAEIATAGLNWIRLPIGHWAISTWDGEPFLEGVSWNYVLKAIGWARKYGIRINFDLHTVPGSQNGWNHSGKIGSVNFLNGPMGLANAQRALDYIRTIAQFISQPEYAPVIPMFGFINEPNGATIPKQAVGAFYLEAYNQIRAITGTGAGNGPMLSIHDAFLGVATWYDFLRGADRLALDQHPYLVFQDQISGPLASITGQPCNSWAQGDTATNRTSQMYGVNTAGEFSAAINDCGQWVNGVGLGQRYDGTYNNYADKRMGSCDQWNDWRRWDQATIDGVNAWAASSMDALQNFFFWTWRIGNATTTVPEPNPFWHYRLGWYNGWIPRNPRDVAGTCKRNGSPANDFSGTYSAEWMTGGGGAGGMGADQTAEYPWPPASFRNVPAGSMSLIPQYTQTAAPITLKAAAYTAPGSSSTMNAGSGWHNTNDKRQAYAAISGCSYPAEYTAADEGIPANACGAGLTQPTRRSVDERAAFPAATPAP